MRKLLLILLLVVHAFSLDIDDIKIMREMGVKIAFPNEAKAHIIPKGMKPSKLMKANYLNLNGASIYSIPKWLPKMTNISRLELSNTNLDLDDLKALSSLSNLDILNLSDTKIFKKGGNLVSFLSNFRLNELNLTNTGGGSSDYVNIGKLNSLIKLDLSTNSISDLDELNLEKLKNLKVLNLCSNNLTGILYTSKLPKSSLRELYLSHNSFTRFKFSGDFPLLRVLDISNNGAYMSFDEEFNDMFLFKSMDIKRGDQIKVNKDTHLPISLENKIIKYFNIDKKDFNHIKNSMNFFHLSQKSDNQSFISFENSFLYNKRTSQICKCDYSVREKAKRIVEPLTKWNFLLLALHDDKCETCYDYEKIDLIDNEILLVYQGLLILDYYYNYVSSLFNDMKYSYRYCFSDFKYDLKYKYKRKSYISVLKVLKALNEKQIDGLLSLTNAVYKIKKLRKDFKLPIITLFEQLNKYGDNFEYVKNKKTIKKLDKIFSNEYYNLVSIEVKMFENIGFKSYFHINTDRINNIAFSIEQKDATMYFKDPTVELYSFWYRRYKDGTYKNTRYLIKKILDDLDKD